MSVLQVVVIMGLVNWLSIVLVFWYVSKCQSRKKTQSNVLTVSNEEAKGIARRLVEGAERACIRNDKVLVDAYQKGSDKMIRFEIASDMHTSGRHREYNDV